MADTTDLADYYSKSAAIGAAKYGGYGNSKFGGLLDMILPAYQAAFPKAPVANALMGARQAWNMHNYNKVMQAQYAAQQARQATTDTNNDTIFNKATGLNVVGNFDTALGNSMAPHIRDSNQASNYNAMLKGDQLQIDPYGTVDTSVINPYMKQMGENASSNAAKSQFTPTYAQGGQAAGQLTPQSLIGQLPGLKGLQQAMNQIAPQTAPQLQNPDGSFNASANGGTSQLSPEQSAAAQLNPYASANVPVGNLTTLFDAGGAAAQKGAGMQQDINQLTETGRHNKADEAIGRTNAQAHMISAQKSGSAGQQANEATRAYDAWKSGLLTDQQYANTMGANKADLDLGALKDQAKIIKDAYGKNSSEAKAAANAVINYNAGGIVGRAAFGNASQAKLQNTGKNVGAKYGVKY